MGREFGIGGPSGCSYRLTPWFNVEVVVLSTELAIPPFAVVFEGAALNGESGGKAAEGITLVGEGLGDNESVRVLFEKPGRLLSVLVWKFWLPVKLGVPEVA